MRYYFGLDFLRAILMLLGVFIHGACFVNFMDWNYKSIHGQNLLIDLSATIISLFRMECFFLLSGFLGCMLLKHKSIDYFIENRIRRVFIPFISSYILFIVVPNLYQNGTINIKLILYPQHLWFLLSLLIISFIFTNRTLINKLITYKFDIKFTIFTFVTFILWVALTFLVQKNIINNEYFNMLLVQILNYPLYYLIFFTFGFLLFNENNKNFIIKKQNFLIILGVLIIPISLFLHYKKYVIMNISFIEQVIKSFSDFLAAIFLSLALFLIFLKFNYSNKLIQFFKDSSLVIYVLHFPIINYLAPIIDKATKDYNEYIFYFSLCLITIIICVILYFLFNSSKLTKYLFGIKTTSLKER